MYINVLIGLCKFISFISTKFGLGAGATWPGEIALRLQPDILFYFSKKVRKGIVLVAGTNGKTTTTLMLKTILERQGDRVIHNASGANLLNGIISAFIQQASWTGTIDADYGFFEIDENTLPIVLHQMCHSCEGGNPEYGKDGSPIRSGMTKRLVMVLLNLFRDQLDRYGEVDVIAEKWERALSKLDSGLPVTRLSSRRLQAGNQGIKPYLIANADDPLIAEIASSKTSRNDMVRIYFGLEDPSQFMEKMEHATDSTFCQRCGTRLVYKGVYYSHIGDWHCAKCKNTRPKLDISSWEYPLPGLYNRYNTLAAVATAKALGVTDELITEGLQNFTPAFGRQEEFDIDNKKVKIFLSKNPAGFNESLRTVIQLGAKQILFVLNDRIPDGRDVSWIWDVDFEMITEQATIAVSGDRCWDMALRLKYVKPYHKFLKGAVSEPQNQPIVYEDLETALQCCLSHPDKETPLYILPTYSAMLEVRKILTGKRIL